LRYLSAARRRIAANSLTIDRPYVSLADAVDQKDEPVHGLALRGGKITAAGKS
jgi:hypothetical protein